VQPALTAGDQARDTDALKERFYLQGQTPEGALKRAKEAAAVPARDREVRDQEGLALRPQ